MLIRLDFGGDVPIYQQLRNQMVVAIAAGQLARGSGCLPFGTWRRSWGST